MEEIWKDIKGYEGLYQVSNLGRVKGLEKKEKFYSYKSKQIKERTRPERLVSNRLQKNGYLRCCLSKNNIHKFYWLHRLVAQAFIPNNNNYPIINHKDENPQNNRVDNLEWCTQKYNVNYGTSRERAKQKLKRKVVQYDLKGNMIKIWNGLCDVEHCLNIPRANIYKCCKHERKTAGNHIWKYYNEIGGEI